MYGNFSDKFNMPRAASSFTQVCDIIDWVVSVPLTYLSRLRRGCVSGYIILTDGIQSS